MRRQTSLYSGISLAFATFALLAPAVAFAQNEAKTEEEAATEIIVTAQRHEELSVDVPITITTLNADQLATANVTQLSDTAKLTPGLRFDSQGPAVQPSIRGVGTANDLGRCRRSEILSHG